MELPVTVEFRFKGLPVFTVQGKLNCLCLWSGGLWLVMPNDHGFISVLETGHCTYGLTSHGLFHCRVRGERLKEIPEGFPPLFYASRHVV